MTYPDFDQDSLCSEDSNFFDFYDFDNDLELADLEMRAATEGCMSYEEMEYLLSMDKSCPYDKSLQPLLQSTDPSYPGEEV